MSVKVTVSWRFMPPGPSEESAAPYVDFEEKTRRDEAPAMILAPDQVLPLGSSVVAPGLAVLMPA
jgi:hypothetical protein